ncbi:hypothetical protein GCM10020000_65180 [Streptomyces olivoverticillatus]
MVSKGSKAPVQPPSGGDADAGPVAVGSAGAGRVGVHGGRKERVDGDVLPEGAAARIGSLGGGAVLRPGGGPSARYRPGDEAEPDHQARGGGRSAAGLLRQAGDGRRHRERRRVGGERWRPHRFRFGTHLALPLAS